MITVANCKMGLINNYGDSNEVQNCRLVGLVDLDHSKSEIRA